MGKFVVVHPVGGNLDMDVATPVAQAVKASCSADAYWIRSTYLPEEGKLYCQWDAKSVDAIRDALAAADKIVPQLPIEGIYEIAAVIRGEDFR